MDALDYAKKINNELLIKKIKIFLIDKTILISKQETIATAIGDCRISMLI